MKAIKAPLKDKTGSATKCERFLLVQKEWMEERKVLCPKWYQNTQINGQVSGTIQEMRTRACPDLSSVYRSIHGV
jgi:hypothetical protein